MEDLVVGVVQLSAEEVWRDPAAADRNIAQIIDRYHEIADTCDLVVMPELASSGYIPMKGYDQAKKQLIASAALRTWDELVPTVAAATAGRRASLIVGMIEPSSLRNEFSNASVMFEEGEILGVHRKIHIPVEENHYFLPGDDVTVVESRLGRIGMLVCYDLLFPEAARMAALAGAELLTAVSNWLDITNLTDVGRLLPAARAFENQMHVVFVNGVGELEARGRTWRLYGGSRIVAATGETRAEAGSDVETIVATLRAEDLVAAAATFPVLRDRRPEMYGALTARHSAFARPAGSPTAR